MYIHIISLSRESLQPWDFVTVRKTMYKCRGVVVTQLQALLTLIIFILTNTRHWEVSVAFAFRILNIIYSLSVDVCVWVWKYPSRNQVLHVVTLVKHFYSNLCSLDCFYSIQSFVTYRCIISLEHITCPHGPIIFQFIFTQTNARARVRTPTHTTVRERSIFAVAERDSSKWKESQNSWFSERH